MQNFVGLQSTRGTGTSGHVQQSRVHRSRAVVNERIGLPEHCSPTPGHLAEALRDQNALSEKDSAITTLESRWTTATTRVRRDVEAEYSSLKREYVKFAVERRNRKRRREAEESGLCPDQSEGYLLSIPRRKGETFADFVKWASAASPEVTAPATKSEEAKSQVGVPP